MAKRSKKSTRWTDKLDPKAVDEALEDATVDCHDEEERHTGLLSVIEDEVEFPFPALVMGEKVSVVGFEWPEDDSFGLDFMCEHDGKRHRVEARSVDLIEPFPKGHLYIAAYLQWKRTL